MKLLTREQLEWCEKNLITGRWKVNPEGRIDVRGNVDLQKQTFKKFPVPFGKIIGGSFYCPTSLESLEGAPQSVSREFNCDNCFNLKSLEGAPKKVKTFNCRNCRTIKDLKGAPQGEVEEFDCSGCRELLSLDGAPQKVSKRFWCGGCVRLKSLKGSPEEVGAFFCNGCDSLRSLEGVSQLLGALICQRCNNLESFEGMPREIRGMFQFDDCGKIRNFKGAPEKVHHTGSFSGTGLEKWVIEIAHRNMKSNTMSGDEWSKFMELHKICLDRPSLQNASHLGLI
jgi:hypothetical protein